LPETHLNLLQKSVNYGCKKFYGAGPCSITLKLSKLFQQVLA